MRVAVVGLGLIGGSLALACRERELAAVAGYDRDREVRAAASVRGACNTVHDTLAAALDGADAVFLAAPVGALGQLAEEALALVGPECVVTDVGSTKRAICERISDPRFIGGHPLAGAETAGIEHARADLFDGAAWYLTPQAEATTGVLYERLHRLLAALGARPGALDAVEHDRIMAAISHMPHVVANVIAAQVADALAGEGRTPLAAIGPSLRDATRVAGSNSAIWGDIYVANSAAIVAALGRLESALAQARELIAGENREAIIDWNDAARDRRAELLDTAIGGATQELRVSVPNRPGVVAEIALALGSAGVNIVDMVLSPSLDGSQGTVALWVVGDDAAVRAEGLIAQLALPVARP